MTCYLAWKLLKSQLDGCLLRPASRVPQMPLAATSSFWLPHTLHFHAVLHLVPLASVAEICSTAFVDRYFCAV